MSDTCFIRQQVFPFSLCLSNGNLEMFKYIFENAHSLLRVEHLKFLLEEIVSQPNQEILDFVLRHPRTHVLYRCLSYNDKMALAMHVVSKQMLVLAPLFTSTRPYLGPYIFSLITQMAKSQELLFSDDIFKTYLDMFTEEDIGDYIDGIGANNALFMVGLLADILLKVEKPETEQQSEVPEQLS